MRTKKNKELQGSDPLFVIGQILAQILTIIECHRFNTGSNDSIKNLAFAKAKNRYIPVDYILEDVNEHISKGFGQDIANFMIEFFEISGKKSFNISKEKYSIFYIIGKKDDPTTTEPKGFVTFNTGEKFALTAGLIITAGAQVVPPKKVTFLGYRGNDINIIRIVFFKKELL